MREADPTLAPELSAAPAHQSSADAVQQEGHMYCALFERPARTFDSAVSAERMELINKLGNKWVSGTILYYYFFDQHADGQYVQLPDGSTVWRTWVGPEPQRQVVRAAFHAWQSIGIGIQFKEVRDRTQADIRIGFMPGNGAWSYLGREIREYGPDERTMNFGWDLLTRPGELDTAIHEIGHTLGFPHEHQNPKAGIKWNDEAVYAALALPPNNWKRDKTHWNILRKLPAAEVEGTTWDPDSIMHYPFGAGLIVEPALYAQGLKPAGGISAKDKAWALQLYPPLTQVAPQEDELLPGQPRTLEIQAGEQRQFKINPEKTKKYQFKTSGIADAVMVLFEDSGGDLRYRAGSDDSGTDANAHFEFHLIQGRQYVLSIRLYYVMHPTEASVVMW